MRERAPSPEDEALRAERCLFARLALEELSRRWPRGALVLRIKYGEDMTFVEIGEQLGITKGRVSQIHEKALRQLRWRRGGDLERYFRSEPPDPRPVKLPFWELERIRQHEKAVAETKRAASEQARMARRIREIEDEMKAIKYLRKVIEWMEGSGQSVAFVAESVYALERVRARR